MILHTATRILTSVVALAACGKTVVAPAEDGASGVPSAKPASVTPPYPSSAPPVDACRTHTDCEIVVWDGPSPPNPCCDARVGYRAMSRAYLEFMAAFRKERCAGVKCPTPPLPGAEPGCCAKIPRCVAKRCVTACEDPTAHVPQVSVLSPECHEGPPSREEPCDADAGPAAKGYTAGSAAVSELAKCCASLRHVAPMLQFGTPSELNDAAALCEGIAARVANGCTPARLGELKKQLRGRKIPDCNLR